MKPIRVYLDSSDYLNLYKDNIEPDYKQVLSKLISYVESGDIEIGFSFFNVIELLQDYDHQYREDRLKRARFVKKLCGKKSFPFFMFPTNDNVFSTDGNWYPGFTTLDVDAIINSSIDCAPLPGQEKAFLKKKLQKPKTAKILAKKYKGLFSLKSFSPSVIPVPQKVIEEELVRQYLLGKISKSYINKELRQCIADLEQFITFYYEAQGNKNYFINILYDLSDKMRSQLTNILAEFEKLDISMNECKKWIVATKSPTAQEIHKKFLGLAENIKYSKNVDKVVHQIGSKLLDCFPGHFLEILSIYCRYTLKVLPLKIKRSDSGDIFHAIYIPYCDLWRGDSKFGNMLINEGYSQAHKIVTKLVDLPRRIEQLKNR